MEKCKNCGYSIQEDHQFCPDCGQKNREKLTFKGLMGELASAYLSWDSKFFRTIVPLIVKPGKVSKAYLSGKRKTFVAPMRMYLFFSILFFFTLSMFNRMTNEETTYIQLYIGGEKIEMSRDSLQTLINNDELDELPYIKNAESEFEKRLFTKMLEVSAKSGSFNTYLQNNISIMFFLFLPVFGWVLKLFFRKKKLDYIGHLIYGIYFHSFFFLILWFSLVMSRVLDDAFPLVIGITYMLIYLMIGVKRFYQVKMGIAILKSIFLSLVYFLLFVVFIFGTLAVSVFMF